MTNNLYIITAANSSGMEKLYMFRIGCHLSSSGGFMSMGMEAVKIGANTFQFFTRNPRGGKAKEIDPIDAEKFCTFAKENDINSLVAHAPYTLNLCSGDERVRDFARMVLQDDLERMEFIPGNFYNFHPGSHVGQGVDIGIGFIVDALNSILKPFHRTSVLLETMSGKGSEIGSRFEELKEIIERVELSDKIGVCLDTCHVNDAGYDIVNNLDGVLLEFDKVIGIDRLRAIHLNDSMNALNSRKDRHQKIGDGEIGLAAIERIIKHPSLKNLPFVLETPNDLDGYAMEIKLLKELSI